MVLISNGVLIYYIFTKDSKLTDIDKMVFLDSLLCLWSIINFARIGISGAQNNSPYFCYAFTFFSTFCGSCKFYITKGIVIYRYVAVVKYSWMQDAKKRKIFFFVIIASVIMLSAMATGSVFYYRDSWIIFLGKYSK